VNILDMLTSDSYSNIVATIAMIVAFVAVPASGYLSYHFAIKGEKRKEFNAIADIIRAKLREQTRMISLGYYPGHGNNVSISDAEFESFIDMHEKKKHSFLMHFWSEYQVALEESGQFDEYNFFKFTDPERLQAAIDRLLPITERR